MADQDMAETLEEPGAKPLTGVASLASDSFSVLDSIGGTRGVVESILPELAFLVLFLATRDLTLTVVVSLVLCGAELVARLVQRQTVAGALTGTVIVLICLFAAYRSGDARNYYLPACVINAVWAAALLVSLAARRPGIGCIVELVASPPTDSLHAWYRSWYDDLPLRRAYTRATWLWVAMFVLRDAVQVPLWAMGSVAALGTATLALGVPLFALVCWASYLMIGTPLHEHRRRAKEQERAAEEDVAGDGAAEDGGGRR